MRLRAGASILVVVAALVAPSGCGRAGDDVPPSARVPDPYPAGEGDVRVVINLVDCDPTPRRCTRYIVLDGKNTDRLLADARARLQERLGWRPTEADVEPGEGYGFDGPTVEEGGYLNLADSELRFWTKVGFGDTEGQQQVLAALRATPNGVAIRVMHNT